MFFELAKICNKSKQAEYNAFRRYALKNDLLLEANSDEDSEFENCQKVEKFVVSIEPNMIYNTEKQELMERSSYTDKLVEIIYKNAKKPCAWKLGRTLKMNNGKIRIDGVCQMNGCSASVVILSQMNFSELLIYVLNYDTSVSHSKSRYVTGKESKKKLNALLQTESGFTTHSILANEYIDGDRIYPAHLSSVNALKQRKYRLNHNKYRHEIATVAIAMMKEESKYSDSIHLVSLTPAQVVYGTPTQKEWLKAETIRNKRIVLSIDATGIPINQPQYGSKSSKGEKRKSFLYQITLHGDKNVPIYQMINQWHDHNTITSFLLQFQGRFFDGKIPHEVVLDDSAALILAVIKAFTQYSTYRDYLNGCFTSLFENGERPRVFIRLDRSHFVNSVMRNKKLNTLPKKARDLYRRIIGYLITVECVEEARCVICDMFVIAKNEYLFNDEISKAKDRMITLARNHKYLIDEGEPEEVVLEDRNEKSKSLFKTWVKSIVKEVEEKFVKKSSDDSAENSAFGDNIYFAPKICRELIEVISKLPMFSNIMIGTFNSKSLVATSSATENIFCLLKTHVLNKKKGLRMDRFIEKSIDTIDGYFKSLLARTKTKNPIANIQNASEGATESIAIEKNDDSIENGKICFNKQHSCMINLIFRSNLLLSMT